MDVIKLNEAKQILLSLSTVMSDNREYLIDLDSIMGDGDLGLTMDKIFSVAYEKMKDSDEVGLGKFFMKSGMEMAKAAPSTMGTLVGSAFMKAGKNLGDKTECNAEDLIEFYASLAQGIVERGKAQLGEKTIVDVLLPVSEDLRSNPPSDIMTVMTKAYELSEKALEKTKEMVAQHGRAAYYQEKSRGHQDAGATVAVLMFDAFRKAFI